jgi:RimJ/RimL family protein N-acetyltransferase
MSLRPAELITARLRLRRALLSDLDAFHVIMSDPETMRYWSSLPHATRDVTALWLNDTIAAEGAGESDEFVIEHEGEVIGKLGAWRLPEVGFFLRRDRWGKGLAREALDAFIQHAKGRGVSRLTADVDPLNTACLALLTKVGFREYGRASMTYIVGSRVCDSVYLGLDLQ